MDLLTDCVERLERLRHPSDLCFARGGDAVIASVSPASHRAGESYQSRLWRFGLDGSAQALTEGPGSDIGPRPSPVDERLAFLSDRNLRGQEIGLPSGAERYPAAGRDPRHGRGSALDERRHGADRARRRSRPGRGRHRRRHAAFLGRHRRSRRHRSPPGAAPALSDRCGRGGHPGGHCRDRPPGSDGLGVRSSGRSGGAGPRLRRSQRARLVSRPPRPSRSGAPDRRDPP